MTIHQTPDAQGRVRSVGPVREGHTAAYGTIAPRVRQYIATHGVAEQREITAEIGCKPDAVGSALNLEVSAGRAVLLFRGVYARPDVAAAVRGAIKLAMAPRGKGRAR